MIDSLSIQLSQQERQQHSSRHAVSASHPAQATPAHVPAAPSLRRSQRLLVSIALQRPPCNTSKAGGAAHQNAKTRQPRNCWQQGAGPAGAKVCSSQQQHATAVLTALCQHGGCQLSEVVELVSSIKIWQACCHTLHRPHARLAVFVAATATAAVPGIGIRQCSCAVACSRGPCCLPMEARQSGDCCLGSGRSRGIGAMWREQGVAQGSPRLQRRRQPLLQLPAGALPARRAAAVALRCREAGSKWYHLTSSAWQQVIQAGRQAYRGRQLQAGQDRQCCRHTCQRCHVLRDMLCLHPHSAERPSVMTGAMHLHSVTAGSGTRSSCGDMS